MRVAQAIASLAVSLDGLDDLVFTAGIGENDYQVRQSVLNHLHWLGLWFDDEANKRNETRIDAEGSTAKIFVVPTDEERMICLQTLRLLQAAEPSLQTAINCGGHEFSL